MIKTKYISKFFTGKILTGIFLLILLGISASRINAQNPVLTSADNPTCADYGLSGSLKVDPFKVSNVNNVTRNLPGTTKGKVTTTVNSSKEQNEVVTFSFTSQSQPINLVIVKGQGSNVYTYNPAVFSGGPLQAPGSNKGISHVVFCYDPSIELGPTAATAIIEGRVQVETGKLRGAALVTILNTRTLETQVVTTSRLGYYQFEDLTVGDTYVVTVRSKGFSFAPQTFTLTEDTAFDMHGSILSRSTR